MKPDVASDLIDEIAPPSSRGNEVNKAVAEKMLYANLLESMGCAEGRVREYENRTSVPTTISEQSRFTVPHVLRQFGWALAGCFF